MRCTQGSFSVLASGLLAMLFSSATCNAQSVSSVKLYLSKTDAAVSVIKDGSYALGYPAKQAGFVVNVTPPKTDKIQKQLAVATGKKRAALLAAVKEPFILDMTLKNFTTGQKYHYPRERHLPYSIFGDSFGKIKTVALKPGKFGLYVSVIDATKISKVLSSYSIIFTLTSTSNPNNPISTPTPDPTVSPQADACHDGKDNDGDGLIDSDDPKCWLNGSKSEAANAEARQTVSLAWETNQVLPVNFGAIPRLGTWLLNDDVTPYKDALAKLPKGQKGILFQYSETFEVMADDADDYCSDAQGKKYRCIFMDKGAAKLAALLDPFFARLKASGADLDYIVLDDETPLWTGNPLSCTDFRTFWDPIMRDSRWTPVASALKAIGFDTTMPCNIIDQFYDGKSYQKWGAVTAQRMNQYLAKAFLVPAKNHFQNVTMSNFGARECKPEYQLPEFNGHIECQYASGTIPFGEQNVVLYGGLNLIRNLIWNGVNGYATTPFSALRFDLNWVKSAKLSGDTPLSAWLADRPAPAGDPYSFYQSSDWVDEITLLALTGGAQRLLQFNYTATANEDALMSSTMKEFDHISGGYPITYQLTPMDWTTKILSSCVTLQGAGNLCRVTTDPACASTTKFAESNDGVTVSACGETKTFPSVRVWSGKSVAPLGKWLVPKK